MAVVANLMVKMQADIAEMKTGFQNAVGVVEKFIGNLSKLGSAAAGAFVGGKIVQQVYNFGKAIAEAGDAVAIMSGKLLLVSGSASVASSTLGELYDIAQNTRTAWEDNVNLYARVAASVQNLGKTRRDVLAFTQTVQQAGRISGATAQESAAAVQQLGQALASGRLQGDELRSILENFPRLGKAIADGLGVTVGQLRQMGSEGALTAEKVFGAIQKSGAQIDKEFQSLPLTLGDAFTKFGNSMTLFLSNLDKAIGLSSTLGKVINAIAEEMDKINKRAAGDQKQLISDMDANMRKAAELYNSTLAVAQRQQQTYGKVDPNIRKRLGEERQAYVDARMAYETQRALKDMADAVAEYDEKVKQAAAVGRDLAGNIINVGAAAAKAAQDLNQSLFPALGLVYQNGQLVEKGAEAYAKAQADANAVIAAGPAVMNALGVSAVSLAGMLDFLRAKTFPLVGLLKELGNALELVKAGGEFAKQDVQLAQKLRDITKGRPIIELSPEEQKQYSDVIAKHKEVQQATRETALASQQVQEQFAKETAAAKGNAAAIARVKAEHETYKVILDKFSPAAAEAYRKNRDITKLPLAPQDIKMVQDFFNSFKGENVAEATKDMGKFGEELLKQKAETKYYIDQLERMKALRVGPTEAIDTQVKKLEQQLAVEKEINEIRARRDMPAAQQKALIDEVIRQGKAKTAAQEYAETLQRAAGIQKEYGSGAKDYIDTLKAIEAANKAGALSETAKAQAIEDATKKWRDQQIAFEHGRTVLSVINEVGSAVENMGSDIYDSFFKAEGGIKQFVASTLQSLGRMVFQMMVWTPIIRAFMSLIKGWLAGPSPTLAHEESFSATATAGVSGARAGGGDVWPGSAFMVGERGPERFVPKMAGYIEPAGGNMGDVNIAIDARGVVTDANDPARAAELGRRIKAAVLDVLRNEKRPGGMLTAPL